ncbi:U-box domain containing protein [Nitzschia inconspicua]|uniref:U-box domain containing protein n=1 Tax=Nitzschia inconspicua TaxID=303405 RepID=A0A9K3L101_9STRA|nr:U-box domain containing protein [Nitzschia inconspicua]
MTKTSFTAEESACNVDSTTVSPETSDVECDDAIRVKQINDRKCKGCDKRAETYDERNDDDDDSHTIPDEFICPLTLEIFKDPLMDRRGMNFEREAIVEWLNRGNSTCPLTREPLGYRSFIPNVNLRARIEHWKRDHGYEVDVIQKDRHNVKFVGLIEAPANSPLELRWTRDLVANRAQEMIWRYEQQQQIEEESFANTETNRSNSERRRRRRRGFGGGQTGYSPTTQQRRLTGLFGEALSMVRRPPLDS